MAAFDIGSWSRSVDTVGTQLGIVGRVKAGDKLCVEVPTKRFIIAEAEPQLGVLGAAAQAFTRAAIRATQVVHEVKADRKTTTETLRHWTHKTTEILLIPAEEISSLEEDSKAAVISKLKTLASKLEGACKGTIELIKSYPNHDAADIKTRGFLRESMIDCDLLKAKVENLLDQIAPSEKKVSVVKKPLPHFEFRLDRKERIRLADLIATGNITLDCDVIFLKLIKLATCSVDIAERVDAYNKVQVLLGHGLSEFLLENNLIVRKAVEAFKALPSPSDHPAAPSAPVALFDSQADIQQKVPEMYQEIVTALNQTFLEHYEVLEDTRRFLKFFRLNSFCSIFGSDRTPQRWAVNRFTDDLHQMLEFQQELIVKANGVLEQESWKRNSEMTEEKANSIITHFREGKPTYYQEYFIYLDRIKEILPILESVLNEKRDAINTWLLERGYIERLDPSIEELKVTYPEGLSPRILNINLLVEKLDNLWAESPETT